MSELPLIYRIPFGTTAVGLVLMLVLVTEIGYRVGQRRAADSEAVRVADSNVVLGSMLALVGLVTAFTYGFTVSHYEVRKSVVLEEANALEAAFRLADIVAEPGRTELRTALRDYARTRIVTPETAGTIERVRVFLAHSDEARAHLWPLTRRIVEEGPSSPFHRDLAAAINDLLRLSSKRVVSSFDRLPPIVLLLLFVLVSTSLAVAGHDAGVSGKAMRWRLIAFALVLGAVIVIVTDFDRTVQGFIQVDQGELVRVLTHMEAVHGR